MYIKRSSKIDGSAFAVTLSHLANGPYGIPFSDKILLLPTTGL
jgi:hypothetical protein